MPKLDSFKILLENKPFDVLTVSENWLKPSILDNEVHLPGFSCVRSDRLGKVGGGCMAYVLLPSHVLLKYVGLNAKSCSFGLSIARLP